MSIALMAWLWLPQGPGSAWFLNGEEQKFAVARVINNHALYVAYEPDSDGGKERRLTRRDAVETGKDWKLWYLLVFNICASVPSQAFSVFLPLVVEGLGYSSIDANLVSSKTRPHKEKKILPLTCPRRCRCRLMCAALLACISSRSAQITGTCRIHPSSGNCSDVVICSKERGYHIVGGILIALVGLIITVTVHSAGAKYAGLCILLMGSYVSPALTVVWLSGNTPGMSSLLYSLMTQPD